VKDEYAAINIKVTKPIKEKLDNMKVHPREPYYEVINRLLDYFQHHNDPNQKLEEKQ